MNYNLSDRIKYINQFFKTTSIPSEANINGWVVKDVSKFVESHLRYINNNDNPKFIKPYLERLEELKQVIEK